MKKTKKKPQDVALITGNPADKVVISPEDPPKKFQTEAIKLLKTKLNAPEFKYLAPTDRVEIDNQNVDKQVKHIRKVVTKISTQPVTEQELNDIFSAVNEAGRIGSILSSPVRAAGLAGKALTGLGTAATFLSTPQSAALSTALATKVVSQRMSEFGKYQKKAPAPKSVKAAKPQQKQPEKASKVPENVPIPPEVPIKDEPEKKKYSWSSPPPAPKTGQVNIPHGTTPKSPSNQPAAQPAAAPAAPSRPQGGGRQKGQLSQTPSAIKKRQQRAQAKGTVVSHREWDYDTYIIEKLEQSLFKKSERSGVDAEILSDVFERGMNSWNEESNMSQQQFAMQRVNSFIAKGKTYYNEDADLQEKSVVIGGRRHQQVGEGPRDIVKRKLSKLFGKHTLIKKPLTPTQKVKIALQRLKRKYAQSAAAVKFKKGLGESTSKPPRKGSLKDLISKQRKQYWDKHPVIEPKDQMVGAAKLIKEPKLKESIDESFVVDRAAGYSTTYTAADLGIKIQGGFALHPSVAEEGGAGDIGTTKLVNKYKKDTPGEAVEQLQRMIRAKRKANTQC